MGKIKPHHPPGGDAPGERREDMSKSEYIIWKCETIEQIHEEHPDWNSEQVQKYFSAVKAILEKKGFFS